MLKLDICKSSGTTLLRCSGRIVRGDEVDGLLRTVMSQDKRHIVVDLSEVNAIDAAGLGALAELERWARRETRVLHLLNPAKLVRVALDVTGLSSVLRIVFAAAQKSRHRGAWREALARLGSREGRLLLRPAPVGYEDEEESVAGAHRYSLFSDEVDNGADGGPVSPGGCPRPRRPRLGPELPRPPKQPDTDCSALI